MIAPMLSTIGEMKDLVNPQFLYEPKLDGIRALLIKDGNTIRVINRKGRDITRNYPELQLPKSIKARHCVLDGEIIVYNAKGNPDFHQLMRRDMVTSAMQIEYLREELPVNFVAFDVLEADHENLRDLPLEERKALLDALVPDKGTVHAMIYTENGLKLWDFIMARHLEGVMAKDKNSTYTEGKRSQSWLKIKNFLTQDCIIVGYSSNVRLISALGLAAYMDNELKFIGKVGTGFSISFIETLHKSLKQVKIEKPAFEVPARYKDMTWVEPSLVCEVQYLELGPGGMLRSPSFLRLRTDKPVSECILEIAPSRKTQTVKKFMNAGR